MYKKAKLVFELAIFFIFSCIIPEGPEVGKPQLLLANSGDTISPYGELILHFSEPILDSFDICLDFSPPNYSYSVSINKTNDTARINMGEVLKGNRRYSVRFCTSVPTQSEQAYKPGRDSVVFFTFPVEQEPNNTLATADTLFENITGTINNVSDVDWFIISDTTVLKFFFFTQDVICRLTLLDNAGTSLPPVAQDATDLYKIPSGMEPPIFLRVESIQGSSGGHYHIRAVRAQ
ncbi:hypothetical protein CHISP_1505 [Chitinispirillum alkaliphilum]|nr:hypothetical protein CHISP_1505 [Chitinispirillum alkaliphilum]